MRDFLLAELGQEAVITRRLLERVPGEKLAWRPHPKSMSLGQLALHVATIPRNLSGMAQVSEFDATQMNFESPSPESFEEVLSAHDAGLTAAQDYLQTLDEAALQENWRLTAHGKEVFGMPRVWLLRSIMMNHLYHHRGQLSVYLRLLEIPVPVIYGRSADENPFA